MTRLLTIHDYTITSIQSSGADVVAESAYATESLEVRELVDRRSDAFLVRGVRRLEELMRAYPVVAADLSVIRDDVIRGLELDGVEDEHAGRAQRHITCAGDGGRAVIAQTETLLGQGAREGAA